MTLPTPPATYDRQDQGQTRVQIDELIATCAKIDGDTILPYAVRLVLTTPNGTLRALACANDGTLSTVAYP